MANETFTIKAKVWTSSNGGTPWHFVSVPKEKSEYISERYGYAKAGFGSIRVTVTIRDITWKTSIFPDSKKKGTYFLPLKGEVRKRAKISEGDTITFTIEI